MDRIEFDSEPLVDGEAKGGEAWFTAPAAGVYSFGPHRPIPEHERVEVQAYPEEWLHLHGKSMSGLRHSHPLRAGEDPDEPWHDHEGEWDGSPRLVDGQDRRGRGAALYFVDRMGPG